MFYLMMVIAGTMNEGLRLTQAFLSACYVLMIFGNFYQSNFDLMWVYLWAYFTYHLAARKYGQGDFDRIGETGPYKVGYTEIKTEKGNFCAVYYPMD